MNNQNLEKETELLDEFVIVRPKKGKIFDVLIISLLCYIVFVIVDLLIDIERLTLKSFDWKLAMMILALPIVGFVFHLLSKKIGWIINFFYYFFITSVALFMIGRNLFQNRLKIENENWRSILMLTLALSTTILLLFKPTRIYFRIGVVALLITLVASAGLGLLMMSTIINN